MFPDCWGGIISNVSLLVGTDTDGQMKSLLNRLIHKVVLLVEADDVELAST